MDLVRGSAFSVFLPHLTITQEEDKSLTTNQCEDEVHKMSRSSGCLVPRNQELSL